MALKTPLVWNEWNQTHKQQAIICLVTLDMKKMAPAFCSVGGNHNPRHYSDNVISCHTHTHTH